MGTKRGLIKTDTLASLATELFFFRLDEFDNTPALQ